MLLERYEDLTGTAHALLVERWTRDQECLAGARIELSVCLELFEADLSEEPVWYQRWYERASPRRRFLMFLSAMDLPEFDAWIESELAGLSLDELEFMARRPPRLHESWRRRASRNEIIPLARGEHPPCPHGRDACANPVDWFRVVVRPASEVVRLVNRKLSHAGARV